MGTKTICIMQDVYVRLKAAKAPKESFSQELRRLLKTKGDIMELAGAWSDMKDAEWNEIEEHLYKKRLDTSRSKELWGV